MMNKDSVRELPGRRNNLVKNLCYKRVKPVRWKVVHEIG